MEIYSINSRGFGEDPEIRLLEYTVVLLDPSIREDSRDIGNQSRGMTQLILKTTQHLAWTVEASNEFSYIPFFLSKKVYTCLPVVCPFQGVECSQFCNSLDLCLDYTRVTLGSFPHRNLSFSQPRKSSYTLNSVALACDLYASVTV